MRSVARCHDCGSQGVTGESMSYDYERKVWRCMGGCVRKGAGDPTNALKAVADVVLAYRPKSRQPKPRKRKKKAKP